MTTPIPTDGNTGPASNDNPAQQATPTPLSAPVNTSDPWYIYAQQMFPNTKITPEIIDGLKKNMMTMINTTISQINARQAAAQVYNSKVAKGEE
jgi:hypothetical protein